MNTKELVQYYSNLLVLQYHGKLKAKSTIETVAAMTVMPQTSVQVLSFSGVPTSGSFTLTYGNQTTAAIAWDDTAGDVETALQALTGLSGVLVTGGVGTTLTIVFHDVIPPADILEIVSTLDVSIEITETDLILPLAIENGFNLTGDDLAVGVQLDTIGEYVGVKRTAPGFTQQITLNDADFAILIRMKIVQNSFGSSLAEIQQFLFDFFLNEILVFDFKNMRMSYLIAESVGSQDLIEVFVTQGLLPKPMGVELALVIYAPFITDFFGFRTYELAAFNASPFNDYDDYQLDWPWLSYANAI